MIKNAKPTEIPNSARETLSNPNIPFKPGINTTQTVSIIESINAPHKYLFCFLTLNIELLIERELNEWKLSVSDRVKNAIVIPCEEYSIAKSWFPNSGQ